MDKDAVKQKIKIKLINYFIQLFSHNMAVFYKDMIVLSLFLRIYDTFIADVLLIKESNCFIYCQCFKIACSDLL